MKLLKNIRSIKTDAFGIKDRLLNLAEQFNSLDIIGKSIGITDNNINFTNKVTWQPVLDNLENSNNDENRAEESKLDNIQETLDQSISQLTENIIPTLQRLQNKWLGRVVLYNLMLWLFVASIIAACAYYKNILSLSGIYSAFQSHAFNHPVFFFAIGVITFTGLLSYHFWIRRKIAVSLASKLDDGTSEFNLSRAFLKNTRIQHSIFRPNIVGLGCLNRKRLNKLIPIPSDINDEEN